MDRHQRYSKRGHETSTRVEFHGESIGAIHFTIVLLYRCVKRDFQGRLRPFWLLEISITRHARRISI